MSKIKELLTTDQIQTLHDEAIGDVVRFLEDDLGVMIGMCPCMQPSMTAAGVGGMSLELGPQDDCDLCHGSGVVAADKAAVAAAEAEEDGDLDEDSPFYEWEEPT